MRDKLAKLHKHFRKPDDPRYGRLDTLADELEKAGVPRGITILALYPFAFSKPHSAVNAIWLLRTLPYGNNLSS